VYQISDFHDYPDAYLSQPTNPRLGGWLQFVGSLKLQVSFAEYSLFYTALLQKRPIILRSLLIVATPDPHDKYPLYFVTHNAKRCNTLPSTAKHCNTLQHTVTHCNTLQHIVTYCTALQRLATNYNTLQHTASTLKAHCNTLQHTATYCNTLQETSFYPSDPIPLWLCPPVQPPAIMMSCPTNVAECPKRGCGKTKHIHTHTHKHDNHIHRERERERERERDTHTHTCESRKPSKNERRAL